jgi:hypothetical protein
MPDHSRGRNFAAKTRRDFQASVWWINQGSSVDSGKLKRK